MAVTISAHAAAAHTAVALPPAPAPEHTPVPAMTPPAADAAASQAPWTTPATTAYHAVSASDHLLMNMTPLEIDHSALATFECPSFNEAEAVDLDGCIPPSSSLSSSWEMTSGVYDHHHQLCALDFITPDINITAAEMPIERVQHETSFQALLQSDLVFLSPLHFDSQDHSQLAEKVEEEVLDLSEPRNRCSYRKGKCDQPRTRKLNGKLHTYCAFHRFRSIENQKQFDAKRRRKNSSSANKSSCDNTINGSKDDGTTITSTPLSHKKPSLCQQEQDAVAEAQGELIGFQVAHDDLVNQSSDCKASPLRHAKRGTRSSMRATSLSIVL